MSGGYDMPSTDRLIIEVLTARYRLGETIWPFESRLSPSARRLEDLGLVNRMSGNVPKTFRLSLTDLGLKELSPTYVPPLLHDTRKSILADGLNRLATWIANGDVEVYP